MEKVKNINKKVTFAFGIIVLSLCVLIPALAHAADWPGADESNFSGTTAKSHVNAKIDDERLSFIGPTVINFTMDANGDFITPTAGTAYFQNNSVFNIKINGFTVEPQSGATGVESVDGQTGNDTYQINVTGNDNVKVPFAINTADTWGGWKLLPSGDTGAKCGLTFSDGKMVNPTGSIWNSGAPLQLVTWTVSSETNNLVKLHYDSQGGSDVQDTVVVKGNVPTKPDDPTREGYEFTGWFTDAGCTQAYNFDAPLNIYTNLFAGWKEKDTREAYAVVCDLNDGTKDGLLEFRFDKNRANYPADHTFDCQDTDYQPGWYKYMGADSFQSENPEYYGTIKEAIFTESFKNVKPISCAYWFQGIHVWSEDEDHFASKLEIIKNLEYLNTSEVTNMSGMFAGCTKLLNINTSKFVTSNLWNMSAMFDGCSSLQTPPDVSKWDTRNVSWANQMFDGCSSLQTPPDVSKWDTRHVDNMENMFARCSSLTSPPDVSKWDTRNVERMNSMFAGCSHIKYIDVSNFDVSYVYDLSGMFEECYDLENIYCNNDWTFSEASSDFMFSGCHKLPNFISDITDITYAYPNNGESGYFTLKI